MTFCRIADILNRGFSGYNTRWCLKMLDLLFGQFDFQEVAALTVCLGANDSWDLKDSLKGSQHVPPVEFEQNLKAIVAWFESKGLDRKRIILCTPPTFIPEDWATFKQGQDFQNKSRQTLLTYVQIVRQVASDLQTRFVDIYQAFELQSEQSDAHRFFVDGLHLSVEGADIFYESIRPVIHELVQEHRRTSDNNFPVWADLEHDFPNAH
jgi:lysophospholipase L1-like esterase